VVPGRGIIGTTHGQGVYKQNPQNLRRNVLPTECMDWPFLMRYEHLTCALIELV
jgi:hypothetical protein